MKKGAGFTHAPFPRNSKKGAGFTLIEILVVIGIIAILAAIVIIAINPAEHFKQARNAQRWSNVNAIINAVHQYSLANNGVLPPMIQDDTEGDAGTFDICQDTDTEDPACTNLFDSSKTLPNTIDKFYIVDMPSDPTCTVSGSTCYDISTTSDDRIKVDAPEAEGATITVER